MPKTGLLLAWFCFASMLAPAAAGERPTVVELFTSEGCSSCPPADALLAELAGRPDVLALSFHVDYWDRLGWTDPFSSPAATRRQQRYADLLGLATLYTPQIVVDGRWQAVGSDRHAVEHALRTAQSDRSDLPIGLTVDHGYAKVNWGSGNGVTDAAVLLIGFDRRQVSTVARGENGGRTLAHIDVVRGIEEVAPFRGEPGEINVPLGFTSDRVAALVQARDGRVLGAAVGNTRPR